MKSLTASAGLRKLSTKCAHFLITAAAAVFFHQSCLGETFKTNSGEEYKDVTVSRVEPDGIVVMASYGIIKIPFAELPKDVQAKYHFDPNQAAAFQNALTGAQRSHAAEVEAAKERARKQNGVGITTTPSPAPAESATPLAKAKKSSWGTSLNFPAHSIAIRAIDVSEAYHGNEVDADTRYRGMVANIGGTVRKVGKIRPPDGDEDDELPYIAVCGSEYGDDVIFVFPDDQNGRIGTLHPGDSVGIKGRILGKKLAGVIVTNCRF